MLLPICCISMHFDDDITQPCTSIRVERGAKPRLQISQNKRTAHVTIPRETNANWPKLEAELNEGYVVCIQKCQEQFKIYLQHKKSRKPELVIYSSGLQHEKDIKTVLKEMSTNIKHVYIAGPNFDVCGNLKGNRVTLEATVGTLHVQARLAAQWLDIHAQNIVVSTEARIAIQTLKLISRRTQIDGHIYSFDEEHDMSITANSSLLHVGVDGCIGESIERPSGSFSRLPKPSKKITSRNLFLHALGSVANHGKIVARDKLELTVTGSWLSLGDGSIDSATRGYEAFKKIKGIESRSGHQPSVSKMVEAIRGENAAAVADLIEQGVDLQDKDRGRTVKSTAIEEYKKSRQQRCKHRMKENFATISALMEIHEWRRGRVQAQLVLAMIDGKCEDMAQFQAKRLEMKIGSTGRVEADSIWICRDVKIEIANDFIVEGQVKHRSIFVMSSAVINLSSSAILFASQCASFRCQRFANSGTLSLARLSVIAADSVFFNETSYSEANSVDIDCVGLCSLDGNAQISQLFVVSHAQVLFSHSCKWISDSIHISSNGLLCHGLVNSTAECELLLSDSAHFFETAKFEAGACSISSECHLVLDGVAVIDKLEAYIRQDLFVSPTGRLVISDAANITAGSFKNHNTIQVEKKLSVTVGSIEQSEKGIVFVKELFILTAFIPSEFAGRILCGHLSLTCHRPCHYSGFIKANDMEVYLPNVADSSLILSGQCNVLASPLFVKGNSSESFSEHNSLSLLGTVTASAIIAPFQSIFIGPDAYIRLAGLHAYEPDLDFTLLVNCQKLTTSKESSIFSIGGDPPAPEAIICSEILDHNGQIRFSSSEAIILAANFVNKGMLTNVDNKQNHVRFLRLRISEKLENLGILSADEIEIIGDGCLLNKNRIFAVEHMQIEMANFDNETGKIESKRGMTLLSGSDEHSNSNANNKHKWLKLNGYVSAASHLHLKARNLQFDLASITKKELIKKPESLMLSATYELVLKSNIHDHGKLKCEAQNTITVASHIDIQRIELALGGPYSSSHTAKLIVAEKSSLTSEFLEIDTKTREIIMLIDGSVQLKRLRVTGEARRVVFCGNGLVKGIELEAENCEIRWEMAQLHVQTLKSRSFTTSKDKVIQIDELKLDVDELTHDGTLTVKQLLLVTGRKKTLHFNGTILGADKDVELTIDGHAINFTNAKIANFGFIELNSKESLMFEETELKYCDTLMMECAKLSGNRISIENSKRFVISCIQMNLSGDINQVENILVNADSNVDFSGCLMDSKLINVQSRGKLTCQGQIEVDERIDFDARWIQFEANSLISTDKLVTDSMALLNRACIECRDFQATALYSIVNSGKIKCDMLTFCSPIVISPNISSISGKQMDCPSLLLVIADHLQKLSGYSLAIELMKDQNGDSSLSSHEVLVWKETMSFLRGQYRSLRKAESNDEFIAALKNPKCLNSAKVTLSSDSKMSEEILLNFCYDNALQAEAINAFKILDIINEGRKLYQLNNQENQILIENEDLEKKSEAVSKLYKSLARFCGMSHTKEQQRESSEDVGYESRGSSDEMEDQKIDLEAFDSSYHSSILDQIPEEMEIPAEFEEAQMNDRDYERPQTSTAADSSDDEIDDSAISDCEVETDRKGEIRRDYIICKGETIGFARLKRNIPKKKNSFSNRDLRKTAANTQELDSNDLVLKRLKMKETLSAIEMKSYGSQLSLFSIDMSCFDETESIAHSISSPFSRSRIPQSSFRSPIKTQSHLASPRRTPIPPSPVFQF